MSKKTIAFQVPKKSSHRPPVPARVTVPALADASVDRWVHRETKLGERVGDAVASPVTITISAAPNWFEAAKIGFFLPYLTVWVWTLGAAQRRLRVLTR